MSNANETARGLQKIKDDFRRRLPGVLSSIADDWQRIRSNGWVDDIARQIHARNHHLAGTGKTFGFPHITNCARIVETRLNRAFDENGLHNQEQLDELDTAIQELLSSGPVVAESPVDSAKESAPEATPETGSESAPNELNDLRIQPLSHLPIYIVEDDVALANHIVMELALQGYDARAVCDLADLDKEIRTSGQTPGAIVMDVIFPEATTGGIDIINKFREEQILKAPVIFISASDSFSTRLEIVRAGGDAFFIKPFEINLLIEKIESLVGQTNPDPLRVLVLDDDPLTTEIVCLYLEEAGLNARATNDPREIIELVLSFNPDLVILDLHMPEINGLEVAQILRQHESCADMPVLFLSADTDKNVRAKALNIGVDDFLTKPIDRNYLVSAVANRAQRARALGSKMYRDSLTRLLVHDEIKNQLEDQLNSAQRQSQELCYAILDLDNFKQVNDTRGHLTGDLVLKSVASLLRRSFRRSDVLGRYGGEEFVVVMPNTSIKDAFNVLDKVRQEFSRMIHRSEQDSEEFVVTFSAGISAFPEFRAAEELQATADQALYKAKAAGRNRICIAER